MIQLGSTEMPTVNAIIPICNWAERLEECLKQLSIQKYGGDFTITVVDCGSNDRTLEVAKSFGYEILTKKHSPIEGLIGLTNHGLKNSSAELVWKVDADNIMADGMVLSRLVEPYLQDPRINLSVPRQITNENYNSFTNYLTLREMVPYNAMISRSLRKDSWNLVEDMWYGIYNSTLMRRSAIDMVGGWDQDIRVLRRLRNLNMSRAALVCDACYYHDQRVDPISFLKKLKRRINYFGSMDARILAEYFLTNFENNKNETQDSLGSINELWRIARTGGDRTIRNISNEFIFQMVTFTALLTSPIAAWRIFRRGLYQ